MTQSKRPKRVSSSPPAPSKEQKRWRAISEMNGAMVRTLWKVTRDEEVVRRSGRVAAEASKILRQTGMYDRFDIKDARILLAIKAVAMVQNVRGNERKEVFGGLYGNGVNQMNEAAKLFARDSLNDGGKKRPVGKAGALNFLMTYPNLAQDFFGDFKKLAEFDLITDKTTGDFWGIYCEPLVFKEIHRAVYFLRMADLTVDHFRKTAILDKYGVKYPSWKMRELANTMVNFWARLADAAGFGISNARAIRANGAELLGRVMKDSDIGAADRKLYAACERSHDSRSAMAEAIKAELLSSGTLTRMLHEIGRRFGYNVELVSHTSDPKNLCRIKDAAGRFYKVQKRRKGEQPEYGVNDINDEVGFTVTVERKDGGEVKMEDVTKVADWLQISLGQKYRITKRDTNSSVRPSGYWAAHLNFKMEEIAVEVQVRSKEVHKESQIGKYSHGKKEGGGFLRPELLAMLKPEWTARTSFHEELAEKKKKGKKAKRVGRTITIVSGPKKDERNIFTPVRESVGAIVAFTVGPGKSVKVEGEDGKTIGLFSECPKAISIHIGKGTTIAASNWKKILAETSMNKAKNRIRAHIKNTGNGKKK